MAFDAGSRGFPAVLDPFAFFAGRTSGAAVVRGVGRTRRCRIETQGSEAAEFGAMHFDEIYTFDDGAPEDRMRWAITRGSGGAIEATEISVTAPVRSRLSGPDWRLRFRRRAKPPTSGPVLLYDARFSLVADDLVMKTVAVSLLGAPVATLHGFHRRLDPPRQAPQRA